MDFFHKYPNLKEFLQKYSHFSKHIEKKYYISKNICKNKEVAYATLSTTASNRICNHKCTFEKIF